MVDVEYSGFLFIVQLVFRNAISIENEVEISKYVRRYATGRD